MVPYPEIDPVAFSLGPLKVHWYGMTYLFALAFAWRLALHRSKNNWSPISTEKVDDLIFYGTMGVFLGGRIGYTVFYNWELVLHDLHGFLGFGKEECRFMADFWELSWLLIFLLGEKKYPLLNF